MMNQECTINAAQYFTATIYQWQMALQMTVIRK